MQAPCKDCDHRYYLCHSECQPYLAFRKERDEVIARRAEQRAIEHIILAGVKKEKKEMWRKKR